MKTHSVIFIAVDACTFLFGLTNSIAKSTIIELNEHDKRKQNE